MPSPEAVFNAFEHAVTLLMRLPTADPPGLRISWPTILRLSHQGCAELDKTTQPLKAAERKELERTCLWSSFLRSESDRRLLWASAAGMSIGQIANASRPPTSESNISRRIAWALCFISYKVEAGETPPGFEAQAPAVPDR